LNDDFKKVGVTWNLKTIDRTQSNVWFDVTDEGQAQTNMKKLLRKGGVKDLNVYSVGLVPLFPFLYTSDNHLYGYALKAQLRPMT
jgi:hypothetical protein